MAWITAQQLIDKTSRAGEQRFVFRGEESLHGCLHCDEAFPQNDAGWKALRRHEFEEHGTAELFAWKDLHGKKLEIAVVVTPAEDGFGEDQEHVDVYGRDEDGTVYVLAEDDQGGGYYGDMTRGGWKWRNAPSLERLLSEPTPSAAARP